MSRAAGRAPGAGLFHHAALWAPLAFLAVFHTWPVLDFMSLGFHGGGAGFTRILESAAVQAIIAKTVRICLLATAISLLLAYVVAVAITFAKGAWKRFLLFAVLFSFWLSILIRLFAWVAILQPRGALNALLLWLGIIDTPLFLLRNELGVVIGMVHYMVPYAVLPLLASLRNIDQAAVMAARICGATPLQSFTRVFLPLSRPGLVGAGLLLFIFSLGFYITPAVLGGGKVVMVAEYIALQVIETLDWEFASAMALMLFVTVATLTLAVDRLSDIRRRGIVA